MNQDMNANNESNSNGPSGGFSDEVKFEEEQEKINNLPERETPGMINLVVKYSGGYIKNAEQAKYVLVGFVAVVVIVSLFLIFGGGNNEKSIEDKFPPGSSAL